MHAWVPWFREAWKTFPIMKTPTLLMDGDKEDPTGLNKKMARVMPDARSVVLRDLRPGSSDPFLNHVDGIMRSDITVPHAKRFLRKHMR